MAEADARGAGAEGVSAPLGRGAVAATRGFGHAPGAVVGDRYRVENTVGAGGMGIVYRVLDQSTGRSLALKRLVLRAMDRERARLLFRREFHTLATLRHPRIVEAFDFGIDAVGPFYTMEFLNGQDLKDLAPVPWRRACTLLRDVASALAFLHARRLLHRDIAPRNVRCDSDGQAKLIDFGLLATVGIIGETAGTPPCIPPEALWLAPLDHRTDLYSLGALGYWLLTGRHAFPVRKVDELPERWLRAPPPPSSLGREVPEELDQLVMSLLRSDPLARPESAAEIIDRLGAIAAIERDPELETARGYLVSAALVGRSEEMGQIRAAVEAVAATSGRALLVEGPSGMGKSRLIREIALEAQIGGLTVLRTDSEAAGRGPWGVLRALAGELLLAAPEVATAAARPRLAVIGRAVPELAEHAFGLVDLVPLSGDPREERAILQSGLLAWLRAVAAKRPLAILVDDAQRSDEASASLLAALAHEARSARLLVVLAVRTDEPARAPTSIAAIQDASLRLRLRGLDPPDIEALARTLFGDVPNLARLSAWLQNIAGGSPLLCTELASHWVDRGQVRYVEGIWVIPDELRSDDAPQSLVEAMDVRVLGLSSEARALGQALSVHGGTIPLELAVQLADNAGEDEVFAAVDELMREEIVVGSRAACRFRHDGLREALLRSIPAEARRVLHLRVGRALLSGGAIEADAEAEVGWHLVHGGDEEHGGRLLESAGRRLYFAQSFHDAVEPLQAALRIREQRPDSLAAQVELRFMLVCAGFLCSRELTLRYADGTLRALRRYSGISAAERLGPFVGKHLAFFAGFSWATLQWSSTLTFARRPNPASALRMYLTASVFTAAVALASFDLPTLNQLVQQLEPLAIVKGVPAVSAPYIQISSLRDVWLARFESASMASRDVLRALEKDRLLPEDTRRLSQGGALFILALSNLMDQASPEALEHIDALERLGMKVWQIGAAQLRMMYHTLRGEEERARTLRSQVEELLLQVGSAWQMEVWVPPCLAYAYTQTRDVIGMKQTLEHVTRLEAAGFPFARVSPWLKSEYYRERGELDLALQNNLLAFATQPEEDMVWYPIMAARADILLASGDFSGAQAVARECLALSRQPGRRRLGLIARSVRTLALAEAGEGKVETAIERLRSAIEETAPTKNPVIIGGLHEAFARVALLGKNVPLYRVHCRETEHWYRPTRNPVLIARLERLIELADTASADESTWLEAVTVRIAPGSESTGLLEGTILTMIAGCRGPSERAARALELILQATAAQSGFLFLAKGNGLVLVAPLHGEQPPDRLAVLLAARVGSLSGKDVTTTNGPSESMTEATIADPLGLNYEPVPLVLENVEKTVVGAAAVRAGAVTLTKPSPRLLAALARALCDAGDTVQPGKFSAL